MESPTTEYDEEHQRADLFRKLPAKVLHHILSLTGIRSVVRMRRLSRRWRRACESLRFILLDDRDFQFWKVEKFARFVNNLLLIRSMKDLHTFQLHWGHYNPLNCNDVRMWIGYAVKHNVKVLDIHLNLYDKTILPLCIFTCRSLEELSLHMGVAPREDFELEELCLHMGEAPQEDFEHKGLVLPDTIDLPSLKKLTLSHVEVYQTSLDQFIAQSPGLEDLNLRCFVTCIHLIQSKVLKRLTLDGLNYGRNRITISAPRLVHFECEGCALQDISWGDRPSLESARIDTCGKTFEGEPGFIGVLLSAKSLALLGSDIKVMLEKELPTCSVFERLVTLELGDWCLTEDFYAVLRFLQLSPRLEKLTLVHTPRGAARGAETEDMPIDGMTFQLPLLKTVIIQCSKGDDGIDKLMNVLAANGISPERISATFYEDIDWMALAETVRTREEREKELRSFEKMVKENPEWVDESCYADSDPCTDDSDEYSEDYASDF